jgi:hypothetical protein
VACFLLTQATHLVPSPAGSKADTWHPWYLTLPAAFYIVRRFPIQQLFSHGVKSALKRTMPALGGCSHCRLILMLMGRGVACRVTYAVGEKVAISTWLHTRDRGESTTSRERLPVPGGKPRAPQPIALPPNCA